LSINPTNKLLEVMSRYQRPQSVPATTPPTQEELTLVQSQDSEASGQLSPAQQLVYRILEKNGVNPNNIGKYTSMINILKPGAGKGIEETLKVIQNPMMLHKALEDVVVQLKEVIENDHNSGVYAECNNSAPQDQSERVSLSSSGLRSGEKGNGQVDSSGSIDGRVSTGILDGEEASPDSHN